MLTGSTATLGRLTASHREGHAAPGHDLSRIVSVSVFPEAVSLHGSGECLWGYYDPGTPCGLISPFTEGVSDRTINALPRYLQNFKSGLLPSLTEGVSDRREVR
ncbi:hypothetical protein SAMN05660836_00456 [Thermodesulforhabdus norvegica]|uniref:Uncharacterized protein n=1 Tax=Thermodesulforhabdus norvegica TaxID=39841 RepID=A0A1I4R7Q2_9BACT|nr:hypothetical protein SAMN05660836_00456 [Thermodesulforhabdus norvegica]